MSKQKIKPSSLILRDGAADQLRSMMAQQPSAQTYEPVHNGPTPSENAGIYMVGKPYEVPLSEIRENHLNARAYYTNSEVDLMGKSMLENGQEVPARGYLEDGHVYLIDGQKRWRGANAFGITKLRVEICVKPQSEKEAYLESRRINVERSDQTVMDDAIRFKYLLDNKVFLSQVELGLSIGVDQAIVSKILSINAIPERIKRRMLDYPQLTQFRVACAISKIFSPNEQPKDAAATPANTVDLVSAEPDLDAERAEPVDLCALADNLIDDINRSEMSARQVEDLVASLLSPRKKKKKVRSEIRNYLFAGKPVTLKVLASKGNLELSVKGLTADKLELLHEKLQEVLKADPA